MKEADWHMEHRAYQDGYAAGFIAAYTNVHKTINRKDNLDHEMIKEKFIAYKQGAGCGQNNHDNVQGQG